MQYIVGEKYVVPCAEIVMDDGRYYDIPIFEHFHADAQFGFPHQHYHIDGRFEIHPRMAHWLKIAEGKTPTIIAPELSSSYKFSRLIQRELKCVRAQTGLKFPAEKEKLIKYEQWYASYVGKKCAGRKCPHFGTEMLEQDGLLVCPMHGLTAKLDTLKIIHPTI